MSIIWNMNVEWNQYILDISNSKFWWMVYLFHLCKWFPWWKFVVVYLYRSKHMHCCGRPSYQEGRVGIPLTSLTPPHLYACPKPRPGFPMSHVIVFLCSVSSVKMRGNCSFYWYWWICFPSVILLFYLLYAFFNITDTLIWRPSFAMQTKERSIRWQNLISTWTVHI